MNAWIGDLTDDDVDMLWRYFVGWSSEAREVYLFNHTIEAWDMLYDFEQFAHELKSERRYRQARAAVAA